MQTPAKYQISFTLSIVDLVSLIDILNSHSLRPLTSGSGALYIVLILRSFVSALWPDSIDWVALKVHMLASDAPPYHDSDIVPIACHSHNDYWRPRPLFTALGHGCSAVEADVWLSLNDKVLVGHMQTALSPQRTLSTLYLDPILEMLDRANPRAEELDRYSREGEPDRVVLNGVFDSAPRTTLVLLIDFKSNGHELWPVVYSHLDPLRRKGYLSHFNGTTVITGPITVVVSGNARFDNVVENDHYRDMFFDAPLELLSSGSFRQKSIGLPAVQEVEAHEIPLPLDENATAAATATLTASLSPPYPAVYNSTNSFYASVSFKSSIGYPLHSTLTKAQLTLMRSQIRFAHACGLKVRYWGVPSWPIGMRNYLWRVMVREGVDFLSVDDVRALAEDNWGPRKGGWGRKWWF